MSVIEVVDPITLAAKLIDRNDRFCDCDDVLATQSVPDFVFSCFDDEIVVNTNSDMKRVFVSIGIFTIIKLERMVQLLIPAYDFCIPDKECIAATEDNPCDLFSRISFPVDEFFPLQKFEFEGADDFLNDDQPHDHGNNDPADRHCRPGCR